MTMIAGIFTLSHEHPIPQSACESLKELISRNSADEVNIFKDERSYFVKVDIRAYAERASYIGSDGSLSLLAGEPLLARDSEDEGQSRQDDLAKIHEGCRLGHWDILQRAEGVFCAAYYQPGNGTLSLIADKLSLRPLFYWIDERYVIFASALRVLEGLLIIPKKMNMRAVTEIVGLGYPLGDRTPYLGIFRLRAAEVVHIQERKVSRWHYWDWDGLERSSQSEEHLLRELYSRFENAVARRIRDDKAVVSFLSGGLDSRCMVAALRHLNAQVFTFNFARPGTQDQVFGNDFAQQIDTIHAGIPKEAGDQTPDYSLMLSQAWNATRDDLKLPMEHPQLSWSGEGGSVLLGHVHMNQSIVDLMRAEKIDKAIEEFLHQEYVHVPSKLFKRKTSNAVAGLIKEGIKVELNDLHNSDPARNFYLFLMLNDQRRKLSGHFENIDLHRLEYQLPFFDGAFLALIITVPIELCLYHRFYTKWLAHFQPAVTSVPWQVYPGHEPCPLPIPRALVYQWNQKHQHAERESQRRRVMSLAGEVLGDDDFPNEILSRRNLWLATWIHSTGWRDYEYVIRAAETYRIYWKNCDGKYVLPRPVIAHATKG